MARQAGDRGWMNALLGVLGTLLVLHLVFAAVVRLDYYDTYENLLNARTVAGLEPPYYHALRPPLPALMSAPLMLPQHWGVSLDAILTVSHVLAVAFGIAALLVVYWLLRSALSLRAGAFGTIAVALSPVINHYLPMARDDIPALLLLTLAFACYLRLKDCWWQWLLCGALLGLAMAMRYNLAILVPAVIGLHQLLSREFGTRWPRKLLCFVLLPAITFLLVPCITYPLAGHSSLVGAIPQFITDFRNAAADQARFNFEPAIYAYSFLGHCVTWPLLILAIAGVVIAIRKRAVHWLFMLLWFCVFLLVHAHVVTIKEARYLFTILPPVAYFAAIAFEATWSASIRLPLPQANRAILLTVLLAWPCYGTTRTLIRFADEVYRVPFEQGASRFAAKMSGDKGQIWWIGDYYPVYPRDFRVLPRDKFTAIYHFAPHVVQLFAGKVPEVVAADPLPPGQPYDPSRDLHRLAMLVPELSNGDVLMINPDPFVTAPIAPPTPRPLVIMQVGVVAGPQPLAVGQGRLTIRQDGDGLVLEGEGLPDGGGVVQLVGSDGRTLLVAGLQPQSGKASRRVSGPKVPVLGAVHQMRYAYPSELHAMHLPGRR